MNIIKIEVIENKADEIKLKIFENPTLVNLLNNNLWKQKIDYSFYNISHPYLEKPVLTVKGKNPKKAILDAATDIVTSTEELKKQVQRAFK